MSLENKDIFNSLKILKIRGENNGVQISKVFLK